MFKLKTPRSKVPRWMIFQFSTFLSFPDFILLLLLRDRAKSIRNYFWILFPAKKHSPGSDESTGTKSFRKFERKVAQNQSRSSLVQKNAILTDLKHKTGTLNKLELWFLTLAIFCWVGLVVVSTLAEKIHKNIEKSGTILIFWSRIIYFFRFDFVFQFKIFTKT